MTKFVVTLLVHSYFIMTIFTTQFLKRKVFLRIFSQIRKYSNQFFSDQKLEVQHNFFIISFGKSKSQSFFISCRKIRKTDFLPYCNRILRNFVSTKKNMEKPTEFSLFVFYFFMSLLI